MLCQTAQWECLGVAFLLANTTLRGKVGQSSSPKTVPLCLSMQNKLTRARDLKLPIPCGKGRGEIRWARENVKCAQFSSLGGYMRIGNRTCLQCYSYFLQFQLVRMLSPLEIQKARDIFHAFDKDEDGYINSHEVAVGFNRWFGNLRVFDKDR